MKPASRRELDFKLVISALDTAITHGEWVKAGNNVVALWKIADECGGEWNEVKALVVKYIKDWVADTEKKPEQHKMFFATVAANGINVYRSFGVAKEKKAPRPVKKPALEEKNVSIDMNGDIVASPYFGDYMPSDVLPPLPEEPKD